MYKLIRQICFIAFELTPKIVLATFGICWVFLPHPIISCAVVTCNKHISMITQIICCLFTLLCTLYASPQHDYAQAEKVPTTLNALIATGGIPYGTLHVTTPHYAHSD